MVIQIKKSELKKLYQVPLALFMIGFISITRPVNNYFEKTIRRWGRG